MGFNFTDPIFDALRIGSLVKREGYSPLHQLILIHLAEVADNDTGISWYGINTIARRAWVSPNHVRRIIRDLERDNFILVRQRPHRTSVYTVNVEYINQLPVPAGVCDEDEESGEPLPAKENISLIVNRRSSMSSLIVSAESTPPSLAPSTATLASPNLVVGSPHSLGGIPPTREWSNPLTEPAIQPFKETRQQTGGLVSVFPSDDVSEQEKEMNGKAERATEEPDLSEEDEAQLEAADILIAACYGLGNREPEWSRGNEVKAAELVGKHSMSVLQDALEYAGHDPFWKHKFSTYDLPLHFFAKSLPTLLKRVKQKSKRGASKARRASSR